MLFSSWAKEHALDIGQVAFGVREIIGGIPEDEIGAGEVLQVDGTRRIEAACARMVTRELAEGEGRLVIGRGADLDASGALKSGEFRLKWPATDTAKSEWKINSGLLRSEMNKGFSIRDISDPEDTGGMYLNAERNLLRTRNWRYDSSSTYWNPPGS